MEATSHTAAQAAGATELAAETMRGDIRDMLLTHVRSMETPWSKLSEREQQSRIEAIDKAASNLVRNSVKLVAHQGFPHIIVTTGKWSVGDAIDLKVTGQQTVENITRLAEHGLGSAILVLTQVGEFFGERSRAAAEPDQPSMALDGSDVDDADERDDEGETAETAAEAGPVVEAGPTRPSRGRNRRTIRESEPV